MSVKHSLLALLSSGPMYGQQLRDEFESRTGGMWSLNVGQVYTTLDRLERDELVEAPVDESSSAGAGRVYVITATGQVELDLWLKAPEPTSSPPRDELVMKVMISASIDPIGTREVVQSHRRRTLEAMQAFTKTKASSPDDTALTVICDAELFRLDGVVRWLDSVDARLAAGERLVTGGRSESEGPIAAHARSHNDQ